MLPETVASNTQVRSPKCEQFKSREKRQNRDLLVSNFQLYPPRMQGSFEAMRQELSVIQKVSSKLQFVSLNESG